MLHMGVYIYIRSMPQSIIWRVKGEKKVGKEQRYAARFLVVADEA